MRKPLIILAVLLTAVFAPIKTPAFVSAQEPSAAEFYTKLVTTYTVDQAGNSRVKHEYTIRNLTPTTFIKQYALALAYPNLSNIEVTENGRKIDANIVKSRHLTTIAITFPQDVVGENKIRNFSIEYVNPDLASIGGNSLEIHAPELSNPEQYNEHEVILITPIKYGNPVRSNHEVTQRTISEQGIRTTFSGLGGKALSVLFGDRQIYSLTLRYNLENPSSAAAFTQVALPPDTAFQRMHYHSLDPLPQEMKRDADGNWIAKYYLPANSMTPVYLTANAKITLEPQPEIKILPPNDQHTKKADYWDTRNSRVAAEASLHRTPEDIYHFVTKTLQYAYDFADTPNRLGAAKALEKPDQAVCQEFADLFIAMSRANHIPARRLTGFAHSQNDTLRPASFNGDLLHAWPEYFDTNKNLWIQVDPTWGNTTGGVDYFHQFDLNHIVFAINGTSSTTPFPAGAYKADDEETKDVEVTFANEFPRVEPNFSLNFQPAKVLGLPLPGFYNLTITNNTGQAWYDIDARFNYDQTLVQINRGADLKIPALLPFQTQTFALTAHTSQWQIINDLSVNVELTSAANPQAENTKLYESQENHLTAGPAIIGYIKNTQVVVGLGVGLILLTLIGGSVLVFRRT